MFVLPTDLTAGSFDSRDHFGAHYSPERQVVRFEIEYYTEHGKETFVDGVGYPIRAGRVQIAKPGQHRYSRLPFRTRFLKFQAEGELAERLSSAPDFFESSHPERLCALFDEIILLNEAKSNELKLYAKLLSLLELVLYDARIPSEHSGASYALVARARRYIEAHATEPIALADVAREVSLSPSYFHTLFTGATGKTPHEYLLSCRIGAAKRLLWDTEIPIAEVAERAGFGTQQYFGRVFKTATGKTPGQYRKNAGENYYM